MPVKVSNKISDKYAPIAFADIAKNTPEHTNMSELNFPFAATL